MLGWSLYVLLALSTGSASELLIALWKKLFSSPNTNVLSDRMCCFTVLKSYFVCKFSHFRKRGWIFFQKALLSVILLSSNVSKYFCAPSYIVCYKNSCFLYFFKDSVVFFLKYIFSKYDLFIVAFLNDLVTYGAWFAQSTLFFNGACLFNTPRIFSSKLVYSSTVL